MRMKKKTAIALAGAMVLTALFPELVPKLPQTGALREAMAASREDARGLMAENEWEVVELTNSRRRQAGLPPLSATASVQDGANIRIREIREVFSHTRPDGSKFGTVMGENGIYITGENIAEGYDTASSVVQGWMDSAGHKENILRDDYVHIGVRKLFNDWDQLFTRCKGSTNQNPQVLADRETPKVVAGTSIESLEYLVQFTCSGCGETAFVPVTSDMCTGYDPEKSGTQTVTVNVGGWKGSFPVTVRARRLVEQINLGETSLSLHVGDQVEMTYQALPSDADNSAITWKSSDSSVASVDADGRVIVHKAGRAEIYCVAEDEGKAESEHCVITATQPVSSVSVNRSWLELKTGEQEQLKATVYPKTASEPSVKWYSRNPEIADVDQDGLVTAKAEGTAAVYCVSQDEGGAVSNECSVKVSEKKSQADTSDTGNGAAQDSGKTGTKTDSKTTESSRTESRDERLVEKITIADSLEIREGKQHTLKAKITPSNAKNKSVTWYSTDEDVVTVNRQGVVRARSEGSAEIYCVADDDGGEESNYCRVTVKPSSSSGSGSSSGGGSGSGSSSGSGRSSGSGSSSGSGRSSGSGSSSGRSPGSSSGGSARISGGNLPSYVVRGSWRQGGDGSWSFTDASGQTCRSIWTAVENPYASAALGQQGFDWFRFDGNGRMVTGWFYDARDGYWYYLNPISDNTLGRMMTGWVWIDGSCYYLNPASDGHRGRMYANEVTPDGYYVDGNGRWVP